jgi:hypothetical protein
LVDLDATYLSHFLVVKFMLYSCCILSHSCIFAIFRVSDYSLMYLFMGTSWQPDLICCIKQTTCFQSQLNTMESYFSLYLSLWKILWLATTSQRPISQTTWPKVVTAICAIESSSDQHDVLYCLHFFRLVTSISFFFKLILMSQVYLHCSQETLMLPLLKRFKTWHPKGGLRGCYVGICTQ